MGATAETTKRPPRDDLFRATFPGVELADRAADGDGGDGGDQQPVMRGHFVKFREWTEIDSLFEGRFMEQFAPGAFTKTFSENRDGIRSLFQHGHDPVVGDKPLGPIDVLREDSTGAYYEVPLLDADYVRGSVLPGLEAGLYGASFRFRVIREEIDEEPGRSDTNPDGIPERTVKEAEVREFGPVTFPAYAGSTAGVRSMTDVFSLDRLVAEPERFAALLEQLRAIDRPAAERAAEQAAAAGDDPVPAPEGERRGNGPTPAVGRRRGSLHGLRTDADPPRWRI